MKHLISIFLILCTLFNVNAQSASELCETGRKAFAIGNFEEAKAYLTKAANMGDAKACGLLGGKTGADWDSAPEQTGTLLMRQS